MQWPSWATLWRRSTSEDERAKSRSEQPTREALGDTAPSTPTGSWSSNLNKTDWTHYTTPQTIGLSIITTATTLALIRLWKRYLRRIPAIDYLKPGFFRHRNFYGYVTRVGDGDNFHFFHTPGGKLMGWGWAPSRKASDMIERAKKKEGRGQQTLHVRIAGVDAPELAHFGRPAQPYSQEAIDWLKGFVLGRRRLFFFKSDVGLNMLKRGLATVYEAKFGSEFGNREEEYRAAEENAKNKKVGMWQEPGLVGRILGQQKGSVESPREYKTRMAGQEKKSNMAK